MCVTLAETRQASLRDQKNVFGFEENEQAGLGKFFQKIFFWVVKHYRQDIYINFLSQSMQRRDWLGGTTKNPKLSREARGGLNRGVANLRLAAFPMFLLVKQTVKVVVIFQRAE